MALLRHHRHLRCVALLLPLVLAAASGGSAGTAGTGAPSHHPNLETRCDAAQRAARDQEIRLLSATPALAALLLGEIHTSAADHAWQLASLEAVQPLRPQLSLALEMIPAARQSVLDRYSAGQIDEHTFLNQVRWQEVWGHDADLYLPLLCWARQRGVPLLALNAEPELVRRVRRQGLAAVPATQREGIGPPAGASPAYQQRLEATWRGHQAFATPTGAASDSRASRGGSNPGENPTSPNADNRAPGLPGSDWPTSAGPGVASRQNEARPQNNGGPAREPNRSSPSGSPPPPGPGPSAAAKADLAHFIDSQLLRDRAMAERITSAWQRDPGRLVVALIGRGHLEDGDGVPRQLEDLGLHPFLSLTRIAPPEGCGPAPARARLGAYLESDRGAVLVRRVAPGSAAETAGLRPGDRILELNGTAVDHAGLVIRGVRLQPDGVPLRLTIERAGRRLRLTIQLPPSSEPQRAARDNGVLSRTAVLRSALNPP